METAPLQDAWGETGPFEGFVPGIATAGALAAELLRVVRGRGEHALDEALPPGARACVEALAPDAQIAFDAATLVIADIAAPHAIGRRFEALAHRWIAAPRALGRIAAVAMMLGAGAAVPRAARGIAGRSGAAAATSVLCEAALAAGDVEHGRAALAAGAARLGEAERSRLRALIRAVEQGGVPAPLRGLRPGTVVPELDRLLAPEMSLFDEGDERDSERLSASSAPSPLEAP